MICYRDMSFCSDGEICANKEGCSRHFSKVEEEKAMKWWGGVDVPVAMMSFASTCNKFKAAQ